jgi:CRISPR system Cascade subunit CasC
MLIELHAIQNHAPSNLNRDDTGSPKEAFFGGHRRARISSQCLKRSIRKSPLFKDELGDEVAFRTQRLAEQVEKVLREQLGCKGEDAQRIARRASVLGSAKKQDKEAEETAKAEATPGNPTKARSKPKNEGKEATGAKEDENGLPTTNQLIFLGSAEVLSVARALKEISKKHGKDFDDLKAVELEKAIAESVNPKKGAAARAIPVEIALFGRMTTSDAFEDVAASVQVAHALSTNRLDHEYDYYTAVDDLKDKSSGDDAGAGMVGDVEFNSSCYYKYFNLDWDAFAAKVQDEQLALKALKAFLRAALLTTPTGKQNSFAAHNHPDFVLVECKTRKIPVSYVNAFVKPAVPHGQLDLVDDSIAKLGAYVSIITKTYTIDADRFWFSTRPHDAKPVDKKGEALGQLIKGKKVDTLDQLIEEVQKKCSPSDRKEGKS